MTVATPAGAKMAVGPAPSLPVPTYPRNVRMAKRGLARIAATLAPAQQVSGIAVSYLVHRILCAPRDKQATMAAIVACVPEVSGLVPMRTARPTRENASPEAPRTRATVATLACVVTKCGPAQRRPVKPRGAAACLAPRALLASIVTMKRPTCVGQPMLLELVGFPQRSAMLPSAQCVAVMGGTIPMPVAQIATEQAWQVLVSARLKSENWRTHRS